MSGLANTEEPRSMRWQRRARTIPLMLALTIGGIIVAPFALVGLLLFDAARGRLRFPSARAYLFLVHYGVNDSVEILLAPWYWILAGFGTRLGSPSSIRRHERVQSWSIRTLAASADRLLGVRLALDEGAQAALRPTPAIVLCRHVSIIDSSLPSLLYLRQGITVRSVIMAELLADPGFDLFYRRTGNIFIAREQGSEARAAIEMMRARHSRDVVAIFPEGRLYRTELRERFQAKVAATTPQRAEATAQLRHVLPARPGGVLTLLDAFPEADVVIIGHAGLEPYGTFAALRHDAPLAAAIRVNVRRIDRADIPEGVDARVAWLDEQWCALDNWVDEQLQSAR